MKRSAHAAAFAWACIAQAMFAHPLFAQGDRPALVQSQPLDLSSLVDDYRTSSWSGGDGITLGEVLSITQDFDGYLWLATEGGLVRFDGLRFNRDEIVVAPSKLPSGPTRAVHFARDGSLWVGYGRGRGVYRLRDDQVREVALEKEISGAVLFIGEDRKGTIWVGHDDGLFRMTGGQWTAVRTDVPAEALRVFDVLEDGEGTVWVAGVTHLYRVNAAGVLEHAPADEPGAFSLSLDAEGHVWVTDRRSGFRRADGTPSHQLFEVRGRSLLHDGRQNFWLTTDGQGLLQIRDDGTPPRIRRVTAQTGLLSDENACIFEDRDGNIWVCSIYGLSRLTPHRVNSLSDLGVVRTLALQNDGTAWVGTTSGLIQLTNVKPRSPGERRLITSDAVLALHTARDGSVWVATDQGLFTVADGHLKSAGPPGQARAVTSIASDAQGAIWVSDAEQGLVRVARGRLEVVGPPPAPELVYVDAADRLWMALSNGTVRRREPDGTLTDFSLKDGLPHSIVTSFHQDRAGGFWVSGNRGLSRLVNGRFETISPLSEPMGRAVTGIVDDAGGDVWLGLAYYGFVRARREDLTRAFERHSSLSRYRIYDTTSGSGYPDSAFRQPLLRSADNTLWSVTTRGISIFDPAELRNRQDGTAGPPRIEGVTVDDVRYRPSSNLQFPPRTNRLGIDYTVVSLSSLERFQYRYRLDGFDTTWIDGTGRSRASYTNLPPGQYRFRLQAASITDSWSDAEVDWAFSIQ
ncbi:MAG: two-component regulator propeller domain-containing protein, partial [Vicinamibacterales bacterium]